MTAPGTNSLQIPRLGNFLAGLGLVGLMLMVPALVSFGASAMGIASVSLTSLLLAVGVGLKLDSPLARIVGQILFVLLGGMLIWSFGEFWFSILPHANWTIDFVLAFANSAATCCFLTWLIFRGFGILRGSVEKSRLTIRVVGGFVVLFTLGHLKAAFTMEIAPIGYQFQITARGTQLLGFPGWAYWHLAAFPIGISLLVDWPRLRQIATFLLLLLVTLLCPLLLFAVIDFNAVGFRLPMLALAGLLPLLFAYLCWWLWKDQGVGFADLNRKDLLVICAILLALFPAAAVFGPSGGSREERMEVMNRKMRQAMKGQRLADQRTKAPSDGASIPATTLWYCGTAPGPRACSEYPDDCEAQNGTPCEETSSVWCFTTAGEQGHISFDCFASEDKCAWARFTTASRCDAYPKAE